MDIQKYIVFLEVAKHQNLSQAAKSLGYTQSGISHTIKRLETEMNLRLFYRNRNGAYLTTAGKEIHPVISQIVQCQQNLQETIQSLHNLHTGTLNIGTYSSVSRQWLPHIIQRFKEDFPSIKIHFKEGGNKDILGWIEEHSVDLGFLSADSHLSRDHDWIPLTDDPLLAVLPEEAQYRSLSVFPLKKFHDQTFILSAPGTDIDIHNTLRKYKIKPDIQYTAQDDHTIVSMVACNLGLSILPRLVLEHSNHQVITLPLEPYAKRQLGIAIPSKEMASPAALKFIEYTKEYVQDHFAPAITPD